MKNAGSNPLSRLKTSRIIFPILLGLGFVVYKFIKEFDSEAFSLIEFTWESVFYLFLAVILMGIRDLGFITRLRILTNKKLSWREAFRVNMLWEFSSTIFPPFIGGTGVALVFLNKAGLSVGKSSAVVMAVSFLDELFFILSLPILFAIFGLTDLFTLGLYNNHVEIPHFVKEFLYFAIAGYTIKFLFCSFMGYGLFINPKGLKKLIVLIFRLPILRRWKYGAHKAGNDIIKSSKELKKQPFSFWLKAFGASSIGWTARFWVANALLLAFFIVPHHLLIFARQIVMWVMMLVIPTPGGSGFSEFAFEKFLGDFIPIEYQYIPVVAISLALLWRLISYYPYMIIGTFIFPKWLKDKFKKKNEE